MIYHNKRGDMRDGSYDLHGYGDEVKFAIAGLLEHSAEFDAIIVTGLSGVLVGGPVTLATGKPLAILRKENDNCHAQRDTINFGCIEPNSRVVFLDDFVSVGNTRARCMRRVAEAAPGARVIAQFTYIGPDGDEGYDSGWKELPSET